MNPVDSESQNADEEGHRIGFLIVAKLCETFSNMIVLRCGRIVDH